MPLLLYLHLMLLAGSPIVAIDLRLLLNFKGANLFANRCNRDKPIIDFDGKC